MRHSQFGHFSHSDRLMAPLAFSDASNPAIAALVTLVAKQLMMFTIFFMSFSLIRFRMSSISFSRNHSSIVVHHPTGFPSIPRFFGLKGAIPSVFYCLARNLYAEASHKH